MVAFKNNKRTDEQQAQECFQDTPPSTESENICAADGPPTTVGNGLNRQQYVHIEYVKAALANSFLMRQLSDNLEKLPGVDEDTWGVAFAASVELLTDPLIKRTLMKLEMYEQ